VFNALLTTHFNVFTLLVSLLSLLLSVLLGLSLSLDVISNTSVLASDSLLTVAKIEQLMVDYATFLLLSHLGEITFIIAQGLDVLVRRLVGVEGGTNL
jgi:hypothetical protein